MCICYLVFLIAFVVGMSYTDYNIWHSLLIGVVAFLTASVIQIIYCMYK